MHPQRSSGRTREFGTQTTLLLLRSCRRSLQFGTQSETRRCAGTRTSRGRRWSSCHTQRNSRLSTCTGSASCHTCIWCRTFSRRNGTQGLRCSLSSSRQSCPRCGRIPSSHSTCHCRCRRRCPCDMLGPVFHSNFTLPDVNLVAIPFTCSPFVPLVVFDVPAVHPVSLSSLHHHCRDGASQKSDF